MNDTEERTDRSQIPDCRQRFDRPEPDRDNRGFQCRKKQRYGRVPAGSERFRSMPLYREIRAVEVADKGRDVACLLQPTNIRRR
jgi:hypothetical protein